MLSILSYSIIPFLIILVALFIILYYERRLKCLKHGIEKLKSIIKNFFEVEETIEVKEILKRRISSQYWLDILLGYDS